MNPTNHPYPKILLEYGCDYVQARDEDGLYTKRIWMLCARRAGSHRYWPDYVHSHNFDTEDAVASFLEMVESTWATSGVITEAMVADNKHWVQNTSPDPRDTLLPYGYEWELEQFDRLGV